MAVSSSLYGESTGIIGYEHADADIDELDIKRDDAAYVWRQVMARNRQAKNGLNTVGVTTTPEGF